MRQLLPICFAAFFLAFLSVCCADVLEAKKNALKICLDPEAGIPGLTTEQCLAVVELYEEIWDLEALQGLTVNTEAKKGDCDGDKMRECDAKSKECLKQCEGGNPIECAFCFGSALSVCCDCFGTSSPLWSIQRNKSLVQQAELTKKMF
ncbi:hypothetical protein QOT17_023029 [Balamuthia mandrillaris]